ADLSQVEASRRDLYVPVASGTHTGKYMLAVEPTEGFKLADGAAEERWREHATRTILSAAMERALDAAGVVCEDRELVVDRMRRFVVLTARDGELLPGVVDDKGEARLGSRSVPVSVDALALEFREKYPRNFSRAEAKAPSEAPAGSAWTEPNPFTTKDMGAMARLYHADIVLYRKWKAEAEAETAKAREPLTGDLMRFFRPGPDFSLTMQGRLYREDRATFDRLKAASEAA
ncbi:hypothetical protein, partial [Methylobacterium oxalidis]|uniref:hypothetical protein n=1 Tax=Methylobacterium oxalidis TaxID=944322 RepID=UPI003315FD1E